MRRAANVETVTDSVQRKDTELERLRERCKELENQSAA